MKKMGKVARPIPMTYLNADPKLPNDSVPPEPRDHRKDSMGKEVISSMRDRIFLSPFQAYPNIT